MLKHLLIRNIILIEAADIEFKEGLNVLSGETGSGKTAIMNALSLLLGERADNGMIRRGEEKAYIEATVDISNIPALKDLLESSGIDHHEEEDLILKREISSSGKSRAFLNRQLIPIALLKKVASYLFESVGQHESQKLFSKEMHRHIVDLFGGLLKDVAAFSKSWNEENAINKKLSALLESEIQRVRDTERFQQELDEIQSVNIKKEEDEELFTEYTRLINVENLSKKVQEILQGLSGDRTGVLTVMHKHSLVFEQITQLDPSLSDLEKHYNGMLIELKEVSHQLSFYQSRLENNPERCEQINSRLTLIEKLKRKYGKTVEDIEKFKKDLKEKLQALNAMDQQIEDLQKLSRNLQEKNDTLAAKLTGKRKEAIQSFEKAVSGELRSLNMPKVEFLCRLTKQERNQSGDDQLEFFMRPNLGESLIPVRESASGGELSRLLLALQAILAGKEKIPTLIFDEIDANIGGDTASIVGEKLREIGKQHQMICITHFPQVAKHADHHLRIFKQEIDGRTISVVEALEQPSSREEELTRMLGMSR